MGWGDPRAAREVMVGVGRMAVGRWGLGGWVGRTGERGLGVEVGEAGAGRDREGERGLWGRKEEGAGVEEEERWAVGGTGMLEGQWGVAEVREPGVEVRGLWAMLAAPERAGMVPEVVVMLAGLAGPRWGVHPLEE